MAGWLRRTFTDPRIGRHLLRDEGEVIVDEVHKHWVVYIKPFLEGLVALGLTAVVVLLLAHSLVDYPLRTTAVSALFAFAWQRDRINGGDVVILRTSGSDGYNAYLHDDIGGEPDLSRNRS